jgi:RecA-family ATPase
MEQGLDLISWDELEEFAEANPAEWFIPGIMQSYSFNVFCGWPKAGKSSYTRDLISCTINGGDFLDGLKVQQGSALYVTTEQGKTAIRNEMKKFGIDRDVMRQKFILSACSPQTPVEFVQRLGVSLKKRPDIRLVVLDTLGDFLPGLNLDNYAEVKPRLGDLVRLCEELRVTILALHHFNKAGKTLLASIAGSQAIAASADSILGIWGTEDRPRYFEATSRNGSFPKTRLLIDPTTAKVSLEPVMHLAPE